MKNPLIDQQALIDQFAGATARQGEALRKSVHEATLGALRARELTLKNIKQVLKGVSEAAASGASASTLPQPDIEALLGKAFTGIDTALLQAVEANRRALEQLVSQGVEVRQTQVKKALSEVDKFEDAFFAAIEKATAGVATPLQGPWERVFEGLKMGGTESGARARATLEQMTSSTRDAMRQQRALAVSSSQALVDGYTALVSGVLIGMAQAFQAAPEAEAAPAAPKAARKATR